MAAQVVSFVSSAIMQAFQLFSDVLEATGLSPFFLSMFAVLIIVTYLISPYIRSSGSDKAKKRSKEE